MAIYRQVHMSFWEDTKVTDDFSPVDRYFMLYLLTNTKTNLIGCYEISARQISYDMGYSVEDINSLLKRFEEEHKVIVYNKENRELLIKNWGKYNWNASPKLEKALLKNLEEVKTIEFKNWLEHVILEKEVIPYPYTIDTISKKEKENKYPMDTTDTVTVTDTVTDYKEMFDTFWSNYPRKESKQKTLDWFKKNKPNEELLEKILSSLEMFKKTSQWQDKQFIPHPTTWLNQKRWEDEVELSTTKKQGKTTAPVPDWYDSYKSDLEKKKEKDKKKDTSMSDEEVEKIMKEIDGVI